MPDPKTRFDELLRPFAKSLYRFALHLTRDPVLADDLYHQAVVVGLTRIDQLDAEPAFRAWMSQIVYRTHLNDRRRASRIDGRTEPFDEVAALPSPRGGPEQDLEQSRLAARIASALGALPEDQARAVWLVDGQGFKFREAAEILDIPRGTAATLVLRGRRKLAESLRDLALDREVAR